MNALAPATQATLPALGPPLRTVDAWRTDRDVLLLCALVLVAAALLSVTPDGEGVSWLGWRLPDVCLARRMGTPCLGCGLTRSFVLGIHGDLVGAWGKHPIGPALLLVCAAQVPLRALRLLRARAFARRGLRDPRLGSRPARGARVTRWVLGGLALLWILSRLAVFVSTGAHP